MNKWLMLIVIVAGFSVYAMWEQVKDAEEKWKAAEANVKAYALQFADVSDKNIALQLTVEQLGYSRDSVLQELDATRKKLKSQG